MKNKKGIIKWIILGMCIIFILCILLWCGYHGFTEIIHVEGGTYLKVNIVSLSNIGVLLIGIFLIASLGYLFGRIKVKGISFGTAGVFLVALLFGYLFTQPTLKNIPILENFYIENTESSLNLYYSKIIQNLGLVFFVSSVGFVAGPTFVSSLRKNGKALVLIVLSITLSSALLCICFASLPNIDTSFALGVLAGSNTTTPGFSSALEAVESLGGSIELVKLGYAVAYPFGVIIIVLFVQVLPKLLKTNIEEERKIIEQRSDSKLVENTKLFRIDKYGLFPLAVAIVLGLLIGSIKTPLTLKGYDGACFSLGTTGGILLTSLLFGHIKRIGRISLEVLPTTSNLLREIGLVFFLIGSGVSGGVSLVSQINSHGPIIIIYGVVAGLIMSIIPLIVGFFVSKQLFKLRVLESLGLITGGRTSTPALGMLIDTAKTSSVASYYASAYPIALVLVVLVPQIIIMIVG